MPGYFASKLRAIFSAIGKSTDVYHATLPSFCAAAIKSGVIALAGGAAAQTEAVVAPNASAAEALRRWRLDIVVIVFILSPPAPPILFLIIVNFHPTKARQRSTGKWSHTSLPWTIFC